MTAPELPEDLLGHARERALGPGGYPTAAGRPPVGEWPTEQPCTGCGWTWSRRFDPEVARKGAMCLQYHRSDPLGPAGTTDPRADLIRTDPGRHAANQGATYGSPSLVVRVSDYDGTPQDLARTIADLARARAHRCPEPPPSHEGWWAAVGIAVGFLLGTLAWWAVLTW